MPLALLLDCTQITSSLLLTHGRGQVGQCGIIFFRKTLLTDNDRSTARFAEVEEDGDLTDLLGELRVLLPTVQLLSAFLITVPFAPRFSEIETTEKHVFLATFLFSIGSLILLSAPAVQHRLLRPLVDRRRFKVLATKEIVVGAAMLAVAVVLAIQLVLTAVFNHVIGTTVAALAAVLIAALWLVLPRWWRFRRWV